MIDLRRRQTSFGDGLIAEATGELWEDGMRQADKVLEDEPLIGAVYEALLRRRPKSRTRGRWGRRWSNRFISAWWNGRWRTKSCRAAA